MLILARANTQNYQLQQNKRHLAQSQYQKPWQIIQGDRVNIQSRNSGNAGRNNRRAYVQEEIIEGSNAPNETGNVQRTLRTSSQEHLTVQCTTLIILIPDAGPSYDSAFIKPINEQEQLVHQPRFQFVRDRDIIRDLEKQRDKLDLDVKDYKRKNEELQKTHLILKRQMSENEDRYHDTVLDLEAKLKKNVDLILKLGNSLQGMFMLGPKPLFVYDQQLKHGLGYPNPYTLKQAISQCPKLYLASSLGNSEISLKVRDNEDTLDDASKSQQKVVQIVLWIVDSGCSKHMTGDRSLLKNFIEKFMGTVRFGNDNFAAITGYGDYIQGNITICHVYYVEGLGHNLFSVGQFCDGDLEVAFRSKTCYVRNLEGDDLLTGGRESNLYTISISDMAASSPVCLMSKATSTKSWLWHRRLSHLNFGTINDLTRLDLVDGLPKFKYGKDHLCSACERGKSKKASHPLKLVPSDHSKLELLHMDLCGPMRKFIAQAQLNYKAKVCKIRTDNGTEFKNATLKAHYEKLGIMQQFSTARTPQQNGVVERRNRTLVEAARTMLIFSRLPEFLWAEAVATACFTQNRSIIHTRHNKTPYELLRGKKPNVKYFRVFGSLCYTTNNRDDLGKMKPKADIGVFIGYSKTSRGFRIYNRRTKKIMETINVKFDELTAMASKHDCLEPELQRFINHNSSAETMNTPSKEDLDNLFGLMYEEYFEKKFSDTPINSALQPTQIHEDSPSTSSIIINEHEAPPIVTTSDEQTSLISLTEADEFNQEDSANFDGNSQFVPYNPPSHEEIESSTMTLEPSNA
ncbi:retrovirus-related pol polyprotein from transposon TNT 1-94 [Tanacetum coccineum]